MGLRQNNNFTSPGIDPTTILSCFYMTPARVAATPKIEAARIVGRFPINERLRELAGEDVIKGGRVVFACVGGNVETSALAVVDRFDNSASIVGSAELVGDAVIIVELSFRGVCEAIVIVDEGAIDRGVCPPVYALHSANANG